MTQMTQMAAHALLVLLVCAPQYTFATEIRPIQAAARDKPPEPVDRAGKRDWEELTSMGLTATKPQAIVELFFKALQGGLDGKASDVLVINSHPQITLHSDATDWAVGRGRVLGFGLLSKQDLGNSTVRLEFLLQHESEPSIWTFILYRGADRRWIITAYRWDNSLGYLHRAAR